MTDRSADVRMEMTLLHQMPKVSSFFMYATREINSRLFQKVIIIRSVVFIMFFLYVYAVLKHTGKKLTFVDIEKKTQDWYKKQRYKVYRESLEIWRVRSDLKGREERGLMPG